MKWLWTVLLTTALHAQGIIAPAGVFVPQVASAVPTLIQGPVSTANDTQIQTTIASAGTSTNSFMQQCFANSTQVGDKVIVKVRTAGASTNVSITDDGSNTYSIPSGASETAGSSTSAIFVGSVTTTSRCLKLVFATSATATVNQMIMSEYKNVGTVDKACAATVTSGTSLACSAMSTTVNGDLVLAYADVVTFSSTPSGFADTYTAQTGSPTWALFQSDGTSWNASQFAIQSTAGSITPAITVSQGVTRANIVGIAIESTSAGGSALTAPYLVDLQQFNSGTSSVWTFSSDSTAVAQTIQVPCSGNQLVLLAGVGDSVTISHVGGSGSNTDNNGNTWNALTRLDSTGDGYALQWWYTSYPATCNGTEKVIVTYSANASAQVPYWVFYDIKATSGYDSTASCSGASTGTGQCTINTSLAGTGNITGATITPSGYPALVLSNQNQDFGTIGAGSTGGNWINPIESVPGLGTGCAGVTTSADCYAGAGWNQDQGNMAAILASGSTTITWNYANTQNQAPGASFSTTIDIK